jgi:protein SCO1/2
MRRANNLPTPTSRTGKIKAAFLFTISLLLLIFTLLGIMATKAWFKPQHQELLSGSILPQPRQLEDFKLISEEGDPFTPANLTGHWTVLFAGYSYCPDVCPTTLVTLKAVKAQLGDDGKQFSVLFLSVDPEHDTPEQLATYVHKFDPNFHAVTGSTEQIQSLVGSLGLMTIKTEPYQIDHTVRLIVINPQGMLFAILSPPFSTDDLVKDFKTILSLS